MFRRTPHKSPRYFQYMRHKYLCLAESLRQVARPHLALRSNVSPVRLILAAITVALTGLTLAVAWALADGPYYPGRGSAARPPASP